jgi:hypothetical protein
LLLVAGFFFFLIGALVGPGEADWGGTSTSVKEIIAAARRQRKVGQSGITV